MNNVQARRSILTMLHKVYYDESHGVIEEGQLARQLGLPLNRVTANLLYLSSSGKKLVELREVSISSGRVFQFATITPTGIDLLEEPSEFNRQFPPQVIHQHIGGDSYQVTIGNNNTQVAVGRDIVHLHVGDRHSLDDLCRQYVARLQRHSCLAQDDVDRIDEYVQRLRALLQQDEIDLGEVQRIKRFLSEKEGHPAPTTVALFSHPTVVEPVRFEVRRLIGES